jgi:hypothetical protein
MTQPFERSQFEFDLNDAISELEVRVDRTSIRPIGDRLSPITGSCTCSCSCTCTCPCPKSDGLDFGLDLDGVDLDRLGGFGG